MRISDWSSDVCSSDLTKGILKCVADSDLKHLPMETLARDFRMITTVQQPLVIGWDKEARKAIDSLRYAEKAGGLARKLQPYLVQVPQRAYAALRKAEIGRASCRERGCRSV